MPESIPTAIGQEVGYSLDRLPVSVVRSWSAWREFTQLLGEHVKSLEKSLSQLVDSNPGPIC